MFDTESIMKDYVDQSTAAKLLKVSQGRISQLCTNGKFNGAAKIGWSWIIPRVSVMNYKPNKRGPKPKTPSRKDDEALIYEALRENQSYHE